MLSLTSNAKRCTLLLAMAAAALAQSASQIESDEVKRVGSHLTCQCGSCKDNLNCMMSAGQCHFCKPARTKIYKMQTSGMDDKQVVDSFIREYGPAIFRPDPSNSFWIVPYASLVAGVFLIWFVIRRMMRKPGGSSGGLGGTPVAANGAPIVDEDDPALAKYREVIEKDLAKLE